MSRYHSILGLAPGASRQEISKAYRQLARLYHPDVNPQPGAAEKFIQITEAYEVLMHRRQAKRVIQTSTRREQAEAQAQARKEARKKAAEQARQRYMQWKEQQDAIQSRAYAQGIVVFALLLVSGLSGWWLHHQWIESQIAHAPHRTQCIVTFVGVREVHYSWAVGDSIWKGVGRASKSRRDVIGGNGLPLEAGDQFTLVYQKDEPEHHYIEYREASWNTLQRYLGLVQESALIDLADTNLPPTLAKARAQCFALLLYENYGLEGLATFLYRKENPFENISHNWLWYWINWKSRKIVPLQAQCGYPPLAEV